MTSVGPATRQAHQFNGSNTKFVPVFCGSFLPTLGVKVHNVILSNYIGECVGLCFWCYEMFRYKKRRKPLMADNYSTQSAIALTVTVKAMAQNSKIFRYVSEN